LDLPTDVHHFPALFRATPGTNQQAEIHAVRSLAVRVSPPVSNQRKEMTIKALVMSDRSDEYTGKKGLVKQQIITVMDQSEGERLAQPIEYAMSDEEKPVHAGKLQDKLITLGIRELLPFGGRLRARGKIVGLVGK
jgi:ribosomal protein S8E